MPNTLILCPVAYAKHTNFVPSYLYNPVQYTWILLNNIRSKYIGLYWPTCWPTDQMLNPATYCIVSRGRHDLLWAFRRSCRLLQQCPSCLTWYSLLVLGLSSTARHQSNVSQSSSQSSISLYPWWALFVCSPR